MTHHGFFRVRAEPENSFVTWASRSSVEREDSRIPVFNKRILLRVPSCLRAFVVKSCFSPRGMAHRMTSPLRKPLYHEGPKTRRSTKKNEELLSALIVRANFSWPHTASTGGTPVLRNVPESDTDHIFQGRRALLPLPVLRERAGVRALPGRGRFSDHVSGSQTGFTPDMVAKATTPRKKTLTLTLSRSTGKGNQRFIQQEALLP